MKVDLAPGLGESQRTILDWAKRRGPLTLSNLTEWTGQARQTLRTHLASLTGQGLIERCGSHRYGQGRPEILYRLTEDGEALFPNREGRLLAELVEFLTKRGEKALLESFFSWRAQQKAEELRSRLEQAGGVDRLQAVANLLTEEGFMAELEQGPDGETRLRLCHCPLKDLVAVSDLPCRFEIALIENLLGSELNRETFMPNGESSCSYRLAERGELVQLD